MNPYATGFNMVDHPYIVPPANDKDYITSLLAIIDKEHPDVLFPQSSSEVGPISRNKEKFESLDVAVMVSKPEPIEMCNNKYNMFEFLKSRGLETPEYYYPKDLDEFQECAKLLGFPNKKVCFKPHISKGSRGFRIIDPGIDKIDLLMNQLPFNRFMQMNEFVEMFQDIDLPQFLLMEYLEGPECTVGVSARCPGLRRNLGDHRREGPWECHKSPLREPRRTVLHHREQSDHNGPDTHCAAGYR